MIPRTLNKSGFLDHQKLLVEIPDNWNPLVLSCEKIKVQEKFGCHGQMDLYMVFYHLAIIESCDFFKSRDSEVAEWGQPKPRDWGSAESNRGIGEVPNQTAGLGNCQIYS